MLLILKLEIVRTKVNKSNDPYVIRITFDIWESLNYEHVFLLLPQYMRWQSVYALVPVAIACLGIVFTITTMAIFVKYRDTPLVRASGRELSYVLLSGLLVCYLNTFILLAKPSLLVCLLQRLVVKTFSFNNRFFPGNPKPSVLLIKLIKAASSI